VMSVGSASTLSRKISGILGGWGFSLMLIVVKNHWVLHSSVSLGEKWLLLNGYFIV
jgi:hypothetical protein